MSRNLRQVLGVAFSVQRSSFISSFIGTLLPESGGQYVYARRALGDYAGFVVGWSDWISTCGTTASVSIVIGEYTSALIPALAGRVVAIALIVTIGFALLQWGGVTWASRTQEVTGFLRIGAFAAIVVACFFWAPARPACSPRASSPCL